MTKLTLASLAAVFTLCFSNAAMAACTDPAGPHVDWSCCDKANKNLIRADLYQANLTGANLSGSTWTDGRIYAEGSYGECK